MLRQLDGLRAGHLHRESWRAKKWSRHAPVPVALDRGRWRGFR